MTSIAPSEFALKLADAGVEKIHTCASVQLVKAIVGGALLALAAMFAVTISVQTGNPLIGAMLFPVGFSLIYLLGCDLLTGVFVLTPIAFLCKRGGVTLRAIWRNWVIVFSGNLLGAGAVAMISTIVFTTGFTSEIDAVGLIISEIGVSRTIGYQDNGAGGMATVFTRAALCNWMVSLGVVGSMMSSNLSGRVLAMWMPIMLFFAMGFEHSIVNMYLFPAALLLGADFSITDYLVWNEIPVILGNLFGGLFFTGVPIWFIYLHKGRNERCPARFAISDTS